MRAMIRPIVEGMGIEDIASNEAKESTDPRSRYKVDA
jgi:hypothetical protein